MSKSDDRSFSGWQERVAELLDAARKCPPDERAALLDRECRDLRLRAEVERRLSDLAAAESRGLLRETASAADLATRQSTVRETSSQTGARLPASTSIGPCRILEHLGQGGMGVVYHAHHRHLDLDVAVKFLHAPLVERPGAAERFLREARLAARLNHPGIVRVFDCGVEDQRHYIVMELVDGQDLREYIEEHGHLNVGQSLDIAEFVSRALGAAWQQIAVIHRDIKPANIIVTRGGDVKVADLGLAKIVAERDAHGTGEETASGSLLGTPAYMSPEQFADSSRVDHRSDIFSLGATLYYLLTGNPPFRGQSFFEIQRQVAESDPEPLPPQIPVPVEALVLRMLAKSPEDRFHTHEALTESIQAAKQAPLTASVMSDPPLSQRTANPLIPGLKTAGRIPRPASPPENRVLLAVDVQNDFCPNGALAVPEGDQVVPMINELAKRFRHVILTQDWHCADHLSFASSHPGRRALEYINLPYGRQILWPDHCVQGTHGAALHQDLCVPHCELIIRKGYHREIDSYSAFFENDRQTPTGLAGYLRERGLNRLFLVGLATDFCVAYSAMDACKLGFEVTVIESACRGIDVDGSLDTAWEELLAAGVVRAS